MRKQQVWLIVMVASLCLLSIAGMTTPAIAQSGNLLEDPGFEYSGVWKTVVDARADEGTFFSVAPAWNGWYTESPRTEDWMNRIPNGYPHTENGARFTHGGNRSQELNRGSATFTAGVYQTVTVTEGDNVIGSAWVRMNLDLNSGIVAQARVGIDTNGGTSPYDSDIVWSPWAQNVLDINFRQLTVNATATGTQVTIWLFATQNLPSDPNGVYWDDASLTIGGSGGVPTNPEGTPGTAVPTAVPPPAVAPFVNAQGARDDGSIVHVVITGDTLAAISVAYGVSMEEILELNGLSSGRFLSVGQELIIREAGDDASGGSDDNEEPNDEDEPDDTQSPSATEEVDDDDEPDATATESTDDDDEPEATATENVDDDEPDAVATEAPDDDEDEPTVEPSATTVPATSTPAPTAPVAVADNSDQVDPADTLGSVCVTLFEDTDVDRIQDETEFFLADGTINLTQDGQLIASHDTDGVSDPFCFDALDSGAYVAVATAPDGYGLTTVQQIPVNVLPGSSINLNFGAVEGLEQVAPPPDNQGADLGDETVPEEESDSTEQLLQISGLIVFGLAGLTLVAGLGMSIFMRRR